MERYVNLFRHARAVGSSISVDLTAQTILPHYASLNPASEDDLHKSLLEMYDDLLPKNELLEITDASKPLVNHLSNMTDGDTESNERKRKYVACTDDVLGYLKLLKQMKKFKVTTPLQDVQNFKVYEVQKFDPSAFISSNPKPKTFLGTLFSSVKELNTKVSILTSELSAANTNISNLTLELSTANTNIENLTSELSTANTKIDTLTSKVRALQIARISERLDSILKNSGRESQFNVFQLSGDIVDLLNETKSSEDFISKYANDEIQRKRLIADLSLPTPVNQNTAKSNTSSSKKKKDMDECQQIVESIINQYRPCLNGENV